MLSCKQTIHTTSQDDRSIWRRKVAIRFHLLICSHCRKYVQHLEILKTSIQKWLRASSASVDPTEIKQLEDQIIQKIPPKNKR